MDGSSLPACRQGLEDLDTFIEAEGQFDGVLAFSQGAQVAATYLLWKALKDPVHQRLRPVFKCAVFFSGDVPADPTALWQDKLRLLDPNVDGQVISIPSANIWGTRDPRRESAVALSQLCQAKLTTVVTHIGEHVVPGAGDKVGLAKVIDAIQRTIERTHLLK